MSDSIISLGSTIGDVIVDSSYPGSAFLSVDANSVLLTKVTDFDPAAMDGIAERLWKKMFCFPVLVVCVYCESINAITNGTCLHCNGPLGKARKYIGSDK